MGLEFEHDGFGVLALGRGGKVEELGEVVALAAWGEDGGEALGMGGEDGFVEGDASGTNGDKGISKLLAAVGSLPETAEVGDESGLGNRGLVLGSPILASTASDRPFLTPSAHSNTLFISKVAPIRAQPTPISLRSSSLTHPSSIILPVDTVAT